MAPMLVGGEIGALATAAKLAGALFLAALAGGLGGAVARTTGINALLAGLLLLAAFLFLAQAIGRVLPRLAGATTGGVGRRVAGVLTGIVGPLLRQPHAMSGYFLSVTLGF